MAAIEVQLVLIPQIPLMLNRPAETLTRVIFCVKILPSGPQILSRLHPPLSSIYNT